MKNFGYVYLLLVIDEWYNEYYKIGITKNDPIKRIKNLQTGNSNKIDLLYYYQSFNYKKIEKNLHTRFILKKTDSNNEWFKLESDDVISFIEYCKIADEIFTSIEGENKFS